MLQDLKMEVSAAQVARMYSDFIDIFVVDASDAAQGQAIEEPGLEVLVTNTVMSGIDEKKNLARSVLQVCGAS